MDRQIFLTMCSISWIISVLFAAYASLAEELKSVKTATSPQITSPASEQHINKPSSSVVNKVAPPGTKIIVKERRSGRSMTLKVNDAQSGGGLKVVGFHQGKPEPIKGAAAATKAVSTNK